ncbi:MAG: thioredoxin [bacterium]
MSVINLKNDQFDNEVLESKIPVIVDFYADWCGPCKAMAPIFDDVSEQLKDQIKFVKVNVDECQAVAQDYGVMSIPTLIIFKNGKIAKSLTGLQDKESIVNELKAVL